MQAPGPSYRGSNSFSFVSYSHRDTSRVYQEICWLQEGGFNVWYDEGIEVGESWREEIAKAIEQRDELIFFVSTSAVGSLPQATAAASDYRRNYQGVFATIEKDNEETRRFVEHE